MPKSSYADFIEDWMALLRIVGENAAELPEVERHRQALQEHLDLILARRTQQVQARANRQDSTKSLDELMEQGKEKVKRLRVAIIASLGPKSERLVAYGIAPQRKRGPRAVKPAEPTPPTQPTPPETPAPAPTPAPESQPIVK
jgi:hypothetical protein